MCAVSPSDGYMSRLQLLAGMGQLLKLITLVLSRIKHITRILPEPDGTGFCDHV